MCQPSTSPERRFTKGRERQTAGQKAAAIVVYDQAHASFMTVVPQTLKFCPVNPKYGSRLSAQPDRVERSCSLHLTKKGSGATQGPHAGKLVSPHGLRAGGETLQ